MVAIRYSELRCRKRRAAESAGAGWKDRDEKRKSAVEMPRCGNGGKPKAGFPPFPQRLEIARAIPTFPPRRRGVEKCKTKCRFYTFPLVVLYFFHRIRASPYAIIQS